MDESVVKIIAAIVGAIAGAILAGLANAYAANRRIKELEVTYQQKLRDNYLENARKAAEDVYIPISISLTQLFNSYERFRTHIDFDSKISPISFRSDFETQCLQYLDLVNNLINRGADVYLTIELDEELRGFNSFLKESLDAKTIIKKPILKYDYSSLTSSDYTKSFLPFLTSVKTPPSITKLSNPTFYMNLFGIRFSYSQEILAAPLDSREFESRIQTQISTMKYLVKEVTLGSGTHSSFS